MDIQKMFDAMSENHRVERARYHLTLGKLIAYLKTQPDISTVRFDKGGSPKRAMSYRGYYSDLAFDTTNETVTVGEFRIVCQAALDATFMGYKGGDFVMSENTPLWQAPYGDCGDAIVGISTEEDDGTVILATRDDGTVILATRDVEG